MIAKDFFKETYGSKQWPPADRNDSPWNSFECLLCGWWTTIKMFGDFPIGKDPCNLRDEILLQHLTLMHSLEERQKFFQESKNKVYA